MHCEIIGHHLTRRLVAHDFLAPQPQTKTSIFFLKHVLDNWSNKYSSKILKQLRDAATPNTKLVVLEVVVPYACHDDAEYTQDGTSGKAPSPLLANWGAVNDVIYWFDMVVRFFFLCCLWVLNII